MHPVAVLGLLGLRVMPLLGAANFQAILTTILNNLTPIVVVVGSLGILVVGIGMLFGMADRRALIACVTGIIIAASADAIAQLLTQGTSA